MSLPLFASLILTFGGAPPALSADTITVLHGVVTAAGYRADGRAPGAVIELRQGSRMRTTLADATGRYRFTGLEAGEARLRVTHIATHELETTVILPSTGALSLDFTLEGRVLSLAPLGISGIPGRVPLPEPVRETSRVRTHVSLRALEASSGMVESGLTRFAARPPNGSEEPEPDRVLYTRGSTVDARMVLLDGAPILTPFHVAGLVPPFDGALLGGAELHLGGTPSRFDGGLSYLLDLTTRVPRDDRLRLEGGVDGVSARAMVEGGLPGGGGILIGGRVLHGLQGRLDTEKGFPYEYGDLLVRTELLPAGNRSLRVTGYLNREGVALELGSPDADPPTRWTDAARWGNRAVSARFIHAGPRAEIEAMVAGSRYTSSVPLLWEEPLLAQGRSDRFRTGLELRLPRGEAEVRFGVSTERSVVGYQLESREFSATRHPEGEESLSSSVVGAYAEWDGALSDALRVRAGVRGDRYLEAERFVLGPRLHMRLLLTERAHLTFSAGRHHQAVPAPQLTGRTRPDAPSELTWHPLMGVVSASHLVVGLEQELEGGTRLDLSGFMKRFDGFEPAGNEGLRASGTDLRVAREGERFGAWFGYSLTWYWKDAGAGGSDRFEGRQLLSSGVSAEPFDGWEIGLTVGLGAGLPLSPLEAADPGFPVADQTRNLSSESAVPTVGSSGGVSPLEVTRSDDFLRVDLELARRLHPRIGGRTTELRPYLRLLNALDQRDALFHYFDRWRDDGVRPMTNRPFLPLIGVEWRF